MDHPHLDKLLAAGPIDYLITDEAHHAISPSYLQIVDGLRNANPAMKHLGVTATRQRGDGKAMANGFTPPPSPSRSPTWCARLSGEADLVRDYDPDRPGWVKTVAGDFSRRRWPIALIPRRAGGVVVAHKEYAADRPAIAFTVSVAGAYALAEAFRGPGYTAVAADGTTDKAVRRQLLADFRAGRFQILVNCGLWTEGLDVPEIACIHLARPTRRTGCTSRWSAVACVRSTARAIASFSTISRPTRATSRCSAFLFWAARSRARSC